MKYDDLKTLEELRNRGTITEEEFQREKAKILNEPEPLNGGKANLWGFEENTYIMFMHLSQYIGLFTLIGFVIPVIMWMVSGGENGIPSVNRHGKNIVNFMISMFIYSAIAAILCIVLIGIPILIVLGVLELVFILIASIKAYNGEYWKYPLSITFLK